MFRSGSDLLSDLPLGILHEILERLPIRDAIRTSILSRNWRYTWTTLPHLLFNDDVVEWEDLDGARPEEFEVATDNVINNVLLLHKGPIHRFEMSYPCHFNLRLIDEWLLILSRKDIRNLMIKIDKELDDGANCLGLSIYSCTKLTNLELWNFRLNSPPINFKGFLFLTSLHLEKVFLEEAEILVANCPVLERLTIEDYENSRPISISAPNLKYINLSGDFTRELCLRAPLLAQMSMDFESGDFPLERRSLDCNYLNFFRGFTNLVTLDGHNYFIRYLSIAMENCHDTLVLHHLKFIRLSGVNFADIKEASVVARLIVRAPNLQKLETSASEEGRELGGINASFKDFGCGLDFTLTKLRVVSINGICGYLLGRQFIKFVLENSPVLETLNIGGKHCTQYFSIALKSWNNTLLLHRLKVIGLRGVNFADIKDASVFVRLIIRAPNLEKLEILASREGKELGGGDASFKNFGCGLHFIRTKLRVVSMFGICGYLCGRQFIKFLLESSPVLETMNLGRINKRASVELLGYRRSSPNARILASLLD